MRILLDLYLDNELIHQNITVTATAKILDSNTRNIYKALKEHYLVSGHKIVNTTAEGRSLLATISQSLESQHKEKVLKMLRIVERKIKESDPMVCIRVNQTIVDEEREKDTISDILNEID